MELSLGSVGASTRLLLRPWLWRLGAENVHACMLPDMDSGEDMLRDAHSVTEWLGIRNVLVRDITPVLRVLGTYELFGDLYAYLGRNGSNALASGSGRCWRG